MKLNKPVELSVSALFEKSLDEDSGNIKIRGFANTVSKDRAGDVIPRSAWEKASAMPNYEKNPIILAFHDHSRPIGKMTGYNISENGLEIEAEISNSVPEYKLIKDGILKTFSVGFRILDADYKSEVDTFFITELELLEISVVSVPCNQDSTFELAKSMTGHELDKLRSQFRKDVGSTVDNPPQPEEVSVLDEICEYVGIGAESTAKNDQTLEEFLVELLTEEENNGSN